jgi:sulfur carrier protein ThiS
MDEKTVETPEDMTVEQLIEILKTAPPKAQVFRLITVEWGNIEISQIRIRPNVVILD